MFTNWRAKIAQKRNQANCPHEWHIVSERYDFDMYDTWDVIDLYCPVCDKSETHLKTEAKRILAKQKVREQYAEKHRIY